MVHFQKWHTHHYWPVGRDGISFYLKRTPLSRGFTLVIKNKIVKDKNEHLSLGNLNNFYVIWAWDAVRCILRFSDSNVSCYSPVNLPLMICVNTYRSIVVFLCAVEGRSMGEVEWETPPWEHGEGELHKIMKNSMLHWGVRALNGASH